MAAHFEGRVEEAAPDEVLLLELLVEVVVILVALMVSQRSVKSVRWIWHLSEG